MAEFHFIEDSVALEVITTFLELAGDNFNAPYDTSSQPGDAAERNNEALIQYQLPGGTSIKGYAEPSKLESMGSAINSMLSALAPFMAAYGLILPILGVIRGIIEVICALINPWAVVKAVIRLFKKWLPPFISLFPPFAGLILILGIIKALIALVMFFITVILPMIQLIIHNIKLLAIAFGADGNQAQQDAGREKLLAILIEIAKQLGILGAIKPLLDIIFSILELVVGLPCKKGSEDSSCCDDTACPEALSEESLPSGQALVLPTFYGEYSEPFFAWNVRLLSGTKNVPKVQPYMQNFKSQLEAEREEPIDEAKYAGQTDGTSHFRVVLKSRRGGNFEIDAPIVKISGTGAEITVIVVDPDIISMKGNVVDYRIVPNWEMLMKNGVVGCGCHPDVQAAKNLLDLRFPNADKSAVENHPEVASIKDDFLDTFGNLDCLLNRLQNIILGVVFKEFDPVSEVAPCVPFAPRKRNVRGVAPKLPPYDDDIVKISDVGEDILTLLSDYLGGLKDTMRSILFNATDRFGSELEVDKNIAAAGESNGAVISVTPKDATGTLLLKNLPSDVGINVSLFTDFGTILNQEEDKKTGVVTADIISLFPGTATITAKVNGVYVSEFSGNTERVKEVEVKFVSDAVLPRRRLVSKPHTNSSKRSTTSIEREPGSK